MQSLAQSPPKQRWLRASPLAHGSLQVAAINKLVRLACGITKPGSVSLNLGTSGVLFGATNIPSDTPRKGLHAFCHGVPETWHVMGVMLSAGGALRWWRDITGASYDELTAEAASVEPGAEGVLFRPYLSGERTPHEDASLSAAFNGVRLHHGREHLTRAVFEGIAFGLARWL